MLVWECFPKPFLALLFCGSPRGHSAKTGTLSSALMAQRYVPLRDTRDSQAGGNSVRSQRGPRPQGLSSAPSSRMKIAPDAEAHGAHARVYAVGIARPSPSQSHMGAAVAPARATWEPLGRGGPVLPGSWAGPPSFPTPVLPTRCTRTSARGSSVSAFVSCVLHSTLALVVSRPARSTTAWLGTVCWMARVRAPAWPLNLKSFLFILSPFLPSSSPESEAVISLDKLALSPSYIGDGEKYIKWASGL